jgi:hypothetical protein
MDERYQKHLKWLAWGFFGFAVPGLASGAAFAVVLSFAFAGADREQETAFLLIFVSFCLVGLLLWSLLQWAAGWCLLARRNHTFCVVMAGLNALNAPLGTILGVPALMVLLKPEVKALFATPVPEALNWRRATVLPVLICLLGGQVGALGWLSWLRSRPDEVFPPPRYVAPGSAEEWCLATGAVLQQVNGAYLNLLGGWPPNPESRRQVRSLLRRFWRIRSRQEALRRLDWLELEGHRRRYEEVVARVRSLPPSISEQELRAQGVSAEELAEIRFVREHGAKLQGKGLLAWDLCRLVNVAGWCYLAGYISEEEAWARIFPAARRIQATYSGWRELGEHYLLGREFWLGEDDAQMRQAMIGLCQDPRSPWYRLPWNMDLGGGR